MVRCAVIRFGRVPRQKVESQELPFQLDRSSLQLQEPQAVLAELHASRPSRPRAISVVSLGTLDEAVDSPEFQPHLFELEEYLGELGLVCDLVRDQ
jgi:hypothetical protein